MREKTYHCADKKMSMEANRTNPRTHSRLTPNRLNPSFVVYWTKPCLNRTCVRGVTFFKDQGAVSTVRGCRLTCTAETEEALYLLEFRPKVQLGFRPIRSTGTAPGVPWLFRPVTNGLILKWIRPAEGI
jgi:hypothetical protein